MAVRTTDRTGPEWVTVQLQIRVPYWRRQQLAEEAHKVGTNIPTLLSDAIDRVYPPSPPK
jgi:hypothetical protein